VKGINQYFQPQRYYHADLQDDHIPFLEKGVSSLHLIPIPFPAVWHTDEDTPNRVDTRTVEDLTAILRVFLIEYLHL
jgi:glutaminyl-peptide cyclotransferase